MTVFGSARTPPRAPRLRARARASARASGAPASPSSPAAAPGSWRRPTAARGKPARCRSAATSSCPTSRTLNPYLDIGLRFEHFFARKVMFVRYASAFVVCPGGYGTLDELFEVLTLIQTRTRSATCRSILIGDGEWDGPARTGCATGPLADGAHRRAATSSCCSSSTPPEEACEIVEEAYARQLAAGAGRAPPHAPPAGDGAAR